MEKRTLGVVLFSGLVLGACAIDETQQCQDRDQACQALCNRASECAGESQSSCLSYCMGAASLAGAANALHDCAVEEGCALLDKGNTCAQSKMSKGTYSCKVNALRICDGDGCCGEVDCRSLCAEDGASFDSCGYASDKGHDVCRCLVVFGSRADALSMGSGTSISTKALIRREHVSFASQQ